MSAENRAFLKNAFFLITLWVWCIFFCLSVIFMNKLTLQKEMDLKKFMTKTIVPNFHHSFLSFQLRLECCW